MHRRQPSIANPSKNGHDLFDAAQKGDFKRTKACIDAGANIEFRHLDRTPLMMACLTGKLEIVKLLVEKGADMNALTEDHWSPLFIASYNGHLSIVEYLLGKKAPVEVVDSIGWNPLIAATSNGHFDLVKLLLKHKADVFQVTNAGLSAHIIARNSEYYDIAEVLLHEENRQKHLFAQRLAPQHDNDMDTTSNTSNINANNELIEQQKNREKRQIDLANELTWQGASKGHIQSIYLGLDQGGDPLYQGTHPYNCIEAAKLSGNRRCCQFLQAMVLFQTRRVKYWTPDDVLLYLEGTLPLHLPSAHMRSSLIDYNQLHPYQYRYIDEMFVPTNKQSQQELNNDQNNNNSNSTPTPTTPTLATTYTSYDIHPYILAYNEIIEQQRRESELRNIDLKTPTSSQSSLLPTILPLTNLDQIDTTLLSPIDDIQDINQDDKILNNNKDKDQQARHMRDVVQIIDGPINGYVLTSPKFFSIIDSFHTLTFEEKRALQQAAMCLRHGSPFPHHIKELFAKYATQFISPDHSLDLTSFNEIQLYLQTFKDIITGAHNLSGTASSTQPLIPILILDEPIDSTIFNPTLIDDTSIVSPTANNNPINGTTGKGFGPASNIQQFKSGSTHPTSKFNTTTSNQSILPTATTLLKRDSHEKNQQELAKMALQWWKLIDYDFVQCNDSNCTRCRLDYNYDTINNSGNNIGIHKGTSSTIILSTNLSSPTNSTPSTPGVSTPLHQQPHDSKVQLPVTLSTTTTKEKQKIFSTPNSTNESTTTLLINDDIQPISSTSLDSGNNNNINETPKLSTTTTNQHQPHHRRTKTTTTTTTTTQVLSSLSSTYYHSRRGNNNEISPLSHSQSHIGFEQAYEHLTLTHDDELTKKDKKDKKDKNHVNTSDIPKCGFMLKDPLKQHKFRIHLLCDGLFTLPAISASHRRSIYTCNQHHQGYSVSLTNAQLLFIAPYLLYTTWLLGLHSTVTNALLTLRGLLDSYPLPSHFDPVEYIRQQIPLPTTTADQLQQEKDNVNGNNSNTATTQNNKSTKEEQVLEPNFLGFPTGSQRFITFCTEVIQKEIKACLPSFIPAIDKNLFQIKSKWFTIPIDRLQDQPLSPQVLHQNQKTTFLSNFIPIIIPTRIVERISSEMRQDQDQAVVEQQTTQSNLQEQMNKHQQPKSAAWRALQKAMLNKQFTTNDDGTNNKDDTTTVSTLAVVGEESSNTNDSNNTPTNNNDNTTTPTSPSTPMKSIPKSETDSTTKPTTTTTTTTTSSSSSSSSTTLHLQDLLTIDTDKSVSLDTHHHEPRLVNNTTISMSSLSTNSDTISSERISNTNLQQQLTTPTITTITSTTPIKSNLPHNTTRVGSASLSATSETNSQEDPFDASRLSAHQKDVLARTIKLMQSPSIQRRKSLAFSGTGDDNNGRSSGGSDTFYRSPSGSLLPRSVSGNGFDINIDDLTKPLAIPPNTRSEMSPHMNQSNSPTNANNYSSPFANDRLIALPHNSNQTPPTHTTGLDQKQQSKHNSNAFTPSKRRTSRTFDTFELLDSSRLSQQGRLTNIDTTTDNSINTNNDSSTMTSTTTTNKDPRHLKQKLLSKSRQSELLLLGQRILRDVEVICEGNTRQATLEIALLLGLNEQLSTNTNTHSFKTNNHNNTLLPTTGTDVDDILNGFDVIWVTELHLIVERLGLKYQCSDVGNIQTMLQFFTTFNGKYSFVSNTMNMNTFLHGEGSLYSHDEKLEPIPLSTSPTPIVQKLDVFFAPSPANSTITNTHDGSNHSNHDDTSSQSTTSSAVIVPHHNDNNNKNTNNVPTTLSTTSGNQPGSTTIISNKVQVKNHQHHQPHLHNITTTTTMTQKNALLVTTTTVVDIVDASSSSSSDDDDDDDEIIKNKTPILKQSQSTILPSTSSSSSSPQTPMIQNQHTINNSTVIPHTPVVQIGNHPSNSPFHSPSITLFESTQLLSNPFIKAKSILFDIIAHHTNNKVHWEPMKRLTSHLVLVSDKNETKMWYMCENHCHLAIELDSNRFEQKSLIEYSEKPTEVKTITLASALASNNNPTHNKKNTDFDSDDELFTAAKGKSITNSTTSKSNDKNAKSNGKVGKDGKKKDCNIM